MTGAGGDGRRKMEEGRWEKGEVGMDGIR